MAAIAGDQLGEREHEALLLDPPRHLLDARLVRLPVGTRAIVTEARGDAGVCESVERAQLRGRVPCHAAADAVRLDDGDRHPRALEQQRRADPHDPAAQHGHVDREGPIEPREAGVFTGVEPERCALARHGCRDAHTVPVPARAPARTEFAPLTRIISCIWVLSL
jgi:hypothetical protein